MAVGAPDEVVDVGVEGLCYIDFGFCRRFLVQLLEVIDAEPLAVSLVAVALHREPCDVAAIGRELGVLVVAYLPIPVFVFLIDGLVLERLGRIEQVVGVIGQSLVRHHVKLAAVLAEVPGFVHIAALHIIEEDVGVGADAVVEPRLAAAGEGDELAVGRPG